MISKDGRFGLVLSYSQSATFGIYCEASGGKLASLAHDLTHMSTGRMQSLNLLALKLCICMYSLQTEVQTTLRFGEIYS